MGILVPLALEKHLSAIMLVGMVAAVMMFVAGTRSRWLLGAAGRGRGVPGGVYQLHGLRRGPYHRVAPPGAWIPATPDTRSCSPCTPSAPAACSGWGWGKSRQKYLYLPFQYNDYIFAVLCEELGLVGALAIMTLFALLILRGYWHCAECTGPVFHRLVCGLVTLIACRPF